MRLTPCDFPTRRRSPKYMIWAPIIEEFLSLDVKCARVEDVVFDPTTVQQVRTCIDAKYGGKLRARTKEGFLYLIREDN